MCWGSGRACDIDRVLYTDASDHCWRVAAMQPVRADAPTSGIGVMHAAHVLAAQQADELRNDCSCVMPDAADVMQFACLSRLTHLDLGWARGVAAVAPLLPDLQSLSMRLKEHRPSVSASNASCYS